MTVTDGNTREQTRALNAQLAQLQATLPPLASVPIEATRRARNEGGGVFPAPVLLPQARELAIPGRAGELRLRVLAPEREPTGVYLHIHGGGFCLGGCAQQDPRLAALAEATGLVAASVEYRLAPEHPFPAAIDAALATWRALSADHPAATIALAGDSAGGGLALALMEALRDAKEPLPAAAALMSPHVDLTLSGASFTERADRDPIFAAPMIQKLVGDYLAGADPRTPRASPLFGSLAGLPPLLIQVGSEELLYSDAERLATAATAAGVEVTYDVAEGLFHVYQAVATAPEAQQATAQVGAFLRSHWR